MNSAMAGCLFCNAITYIGCVSFGQITGLIIFFLLLYCGNNYSISLKQMFLCFWLPETLVCFFFLLEEMKREVLDCQQDMFMRVHTMYIDIAAKFSFHQDIGFSPFTLFSFHCLSSLLSFCTDFLSYRSLSQTKQSRTRSDSPYVRLLGDNLYTRPPI